MSRSSPDAEPQDSVFEAGVLLAIFRGDPDAERALDLPSDLFLDGRFAHLHRFFVAHRDDPPEERRSAALLRAAYVRAGGDDETLARMWQSPMGVRDLPAYVAEMVRAAKTHHYRHALAQASAGDGEGVATLHRALQDRIEALDALVIPHPHSATAAETMAEWEQMPIVPAVATGLTPIDALLDGGIRPGKLSILVAAPGCGKSVLAAQMAYELAAHGYRSLIVSVEMTREEIADRLVSRLSGRTMIGGQARQRSRDDAANAHADAAIARAVAVIKEQPLHFLDASHGGEIDVGRIENEIRALSLRYDEERNETTPWAARSGPKGKPPLTFVVVDYLQLLKGEPERGKTDAQMLGEISRALKLIAMRYAVHILAMSSINRRPRAGEQLTIDHINGSGKIGSDADIVIAMTSPTPAPDPLRDLGGDWDETPDVDTGGARPARHRLLELTTLKFRGGPVNRTVRAVLISDIQAVRSLSAIERAAMGGASHPA